jgi:hypothetical protein
MSDMLKRYEDSKKPRPTEAKKYPDLAVNFFDVENTYQDGFTTKEKKGDPTKFTQKALDYFAFQLSNIAVPPSFQPIEQGVELSRWSPTHKYFNEGGSGQ